jgi:acetyl esterase/lipase
MKRSRLFTALGLLAVLLTSLGCQHLIVGLAKQISEPEWADPPEDIAVARDIVFAETEQGTLLLDLYTPKVRPAEPLPLVVWVYGGGWFVGNRNQIQLSRAHYLTRRGYAVASVSYRLSPVAPHPAQIHDVKAAVRFLRLNKDELGLDTARIGIWGASAGGHLVALMGTTNGNAEFEGDVGGEALRGVSSDVAAVVNYFGPVDLAKLHVDAGQDDAGFMVEAFLGGPLVENREAAVQASPVTWASASSAPMLHVHGTEDPTVAFRQSERIHQALIEAGADSTLRTVEGGGHGRDGEFDGDVLIDEIGVFFDRHLK